MIFIGEPGMVVIDSISRRPLFRFNENGEYETDNEALIARMKPHFKVKEVAVEATDTPEEKKKRHRGKPATTRKNTARF